ncbi:FKBP-type peptidylprolyl isomerase [Flavobacterium sp. GA093]|uniref:FKBP-type peptidylprolyl isomerase n=1 Tax=Flavobacterium hydrocarbonoxydans TaxID=2683249 RepID=A0A6I4NRJ5_9FLAO|nr:FKBP-type peptidylprolyl isomerase [Flavobacterium hydrocarbonoxydans]MWB96833.1 FKBP-type peptidylprolyl isomerase [Flavobacterium hydrocarbonoxydans]
MNKFKYFFILLLMAGVSLVSCNKDDNDVTIVPPRDQGVQYTQDIETIENYLNTHYIVVSENMDVKIDSINDPTTQLPIMSYKTNSGTTFPQLKTKNVNLYGVDFLVYYLILREGVNENPTNTDGVLAAYNGDYLTRVEKTETKPLYVKQTTFETVLYPQSFLNLYGVITGWSEIFPLFKSGNYSANAAGEITYTDFGAGVIFIPSGLGYFASGSASIPAYAPLVFSFKLYDVQRSDTDGDGVLDLYEDLNKDHFVYDFRNTTRYPSGAPGGKNLDDTDGDGIPDFLDIDDDGDSFSTLLEVTKADGEIGKVGEINYGPSKYFPFDAFTVADNPATPNDDESLNTEPRGIPRRPTGALADPTKVESATNKRKYIETDYTDNSRLRIYLDKTYPIKN